ncbi:flagellar motor switch protein FliN [Ralstonia pickettii]|uniref:flagellar motor switch protein FliN n=1 Tax=Ralstonia pickettii TaxID=329 RepID=UPI0027145B05|nr:flagellar motor switch protein FliN [Ralstonia pickettii]WKZ87483.1 flagellar motor switch protein FliN [Ralstonia pickettii]
MTTEPTMNPEANADDVDVEMTMEEAMALEAAQRAAANPPAAESSPVFKPLTADGLGAAQRNDIDMILDIPVQLTVELGRTKVPIKNLLQLAQGSVVELDALAGEPMDVLVNGYLIAQGEVVVVNEKFGIRLTDIITPSERIRKLNR